MNNNIKDAREAPIFKYLDQFSGMVARSLVIKFQNPEEPAEIKTGFDEGESEKVNNQE